MTIPKGFLIGVTEVTREQFGLFIVESGHRPFISSGRRTLRFPDGRTATGDVEISWRLPGFAQVSGDPVAMVSWNDAVAYCDWLSKREGRKYRLPTEAEWEYACRAGTDTPYFNGTTANDLKKVGWCNFNTFRAFFGSSNTGTKPVGSFEPNPWGLFDVHGNVQEWTSDFLGEYPSEAVTDPKGPAEGEKRVHRGGAWSDNPNACRSAYRGASPPDSGYPHVGFRVVLEE